MSPWWGGGVPCSGRMPRGGQAKLRADIVASCHRSRLGVRRWRGTTASAAFCSATGRSVPEQDARNSDDTD